ncbi:MAG: 4-hydroxythreonine-4-phosphate dehydrogenase PdxA [Deltaproteobacteria bacterium]|nr:4-hydroxythreonine-4-phosphate dehydrogenase PdxA [Deltaproteobacteria bacterium]
MMLAGSCLRVILVTMHVALGRVPRALSIDGAARTITIGAAHLRRYHRLARRSGVDASGPYPADSLFFQAAHGKRFDAVIAMYHDQGSIPLKLLHFHDGVNVTLGLPIIRTSPDRGIAYDIAGSGTAHAGSRRAAIALAHSMSRAGAAAAPRQRWAS